MSEMERELKEAIQGIMNKINRVTCPHRHGQKVPVKDLDGLANRQLDFEKFLETYEPPTTTLFAIRDKVSGEFVCWTSGAGVALDSSMFITDTNRDKIEGIFKAIKEGRLFVMDCSENITSKTDLEIVRLDLIIAVEEGS